MYPPQLSELIALALSRLQADMSRAAPYMAEQVSLWQKHLAGVGLPEDYFKHPLAFPSLLLPWWLEQAIGGRPDPAFQADLVYSTINGYYAIRLMDNLMDGHTTVELQLLPALNFFSTQFQAAYQPYFAADQPFWLYFTSIWFHSAEVTIRDATLTNLEASQFEQIAAQKVCAAKIPLSAVCYRYHRPDLIEPWAGLVDRLGCWHQFWNDLFGWQRDYNHQIATYFLSEAERRRRPDEPVAVWVVREGFSWAIDWLQEWLSALQDWAVQLDSPSLQSYLHTRQIMLEQQAAEVMPGLQSLARILP